MLSTTLPLESQQDTPHVLIIQGLVQVPHPSTPEILCLLPDLANPYLVCFSQDSAFDGPFSVLFA